MKKSVLCLVLAMFSNSVFATSNVIADRLQSSGALEKIDKRAQRKIQQFAGGRVNLVGFKIDWNDDLRKTKCITPDETLADGQVIFDANDSYAATCTVPFYSNSTSGYLTLVMNTSHKEMDVEIVVMNIVFN